MMFSLRRSDVRCFDVFPLCNPGKWCCHHNVVWWCFNFTALMCGVVMMSVALAASHLSGLIQAAITIYSIVAGPTMGVFVLGIAVPMCGKKGAFGGLGVALVSCLCIYELDWLIIQKVEISLKIIQPTRYMGHNGLSTHYLNMLNFTQDFLSSLFPHAQSTSTSSTSLHLATSKIWTQRHTYITQIWSLLFLHPLLFNITPI